LCVLIHSCTVSRLAGALPSRAHDICAVTLWWSYHAT
jgi:hypothetical protein